MTDIQPVSGPVRVGVAVEIDEWTSPNKVACLCFLEENSDEGGDATMPTAPATSSGVSVHEEEKGRSSVFKVVADGLSSFLLTPPRGADETSFAARTLAHAQLKARIEDSSVCERLGAGHRILDAARYERRGDEIVEYAPALVLQMPHGDESLTPDALTKILPSCSIVALRFEGERQSARETLNQRDGDISFTLRAVPPPAAHPVLARDTWCALYRTRGEAERIMHENLPSLRAHHPEHAEAFDELERLLIVTRVEDALINNARPHPIIVVEGLDGTGKTTLVASLTARLGATALRTPPALPGAASKLRAIFDAQPESVRRAFYACTNYIAARQMHEATQQGPVVVDRFWGSTAAYGLARAVYCRAHLPPSGHTAYTWPRDLLQPDLVLLLSVSEDARAARIQSRAALTAVALDGEERQLAAGRRLREAVAEAYTRLAATWEEAASGSTGSSSPSAESTPSQTTKAVGGVEASGPRVVRVDASGSPDVVCDEAVEAVRSALNIRREN